MNKTTKQLFNAPWTIEEEAPLAWYCVIDSKDSVVANDVRDQKTVNRLARLPELYDALAEAMQYHCSSCVGFDVSDIPITDILKNCQRVDCCANGWLELLQKVRDGK